MEIVGNLSCFRVGDVGQEDPIELEKKELGEEANLKNKRQSTGLLIAHRRLSTTSNREEKVAQYVNRQQTLSTETGARVCRQPEVRIRFMFLFQTHSSFFSGGLRIELNFFSNEDLFLKFEGFKILLDQENQLLQGLIKFFKHSMIKIIS